ncbi:MAG: WD40 repeat domain-containing protein [Crinalium sp.]
MSNRRYFLQKLLKASLGATALQLFDFGQLSAGKIALAESTNSENITQLNLFPRLVYDYLSPVLNGLGEGVGSFYRGVGEGAGNIVRGFGEGVGQGSGDVARGVGEGLRVRLRDVISNEKGKQKILEYAVDQNAQKQREIIELIRDSLREYQAKAIDLKLTEIQSNWDLENWAGILSRQETENLLKDKKNCLLVLFSPPNISSDAPLSIRNNLLIELESVGTTLAKYYPERSKQYAVKFYSRYFKRPIGDIIVEQLHGILAPIPTAIFYMDVTDYACRFNVGYWGIQSQDVTIVSSPLWNWERTKEQLMSSGLDQVASLRSIRQSMVNSNQLLASYLVDSYYLNLDPYYQLQFSNVSADLVQELTNDLAQKGVAQESIKPYFVQLQGIQQQEQQVYEQELKAVAWEIKEEETIKTNAQKWKLTRTIEAHHNYVNGIAISPDGETIASASGDKTIKLWNLKTGELIRTLSGHSDWVKPVIFTPDSQTLASASGDKTIKLWNLKTSTLNGHSETVWSLAISPDGQILASGSYDDTIKLWNLKTRQLIRTLSGHSNDIYAVAFSPDGSMLASGSDDKTIKLWNLKIGQLIRTLQGHSDSIFTVAISPDGQTLASGSPDKTIKLWDMKTGELIRTIAGHSDWVESVAFSPDGKMLASGSDDKTIKLWNLKTGEVVRTLEGHSNWVLSVAFSPDGHTLVSGSADYTIKIWRDI